MRNLLRLTLILSILLPSAIARAVTFDWSYSGVDVSGNGTFDAAASGVGQFKVDAISGTANGVAITGLTDYAFPDQTIYTSSPQLDFLGLSFTAGGQAFNLLYNTSAFGAYSCGIAGYCLIGPGAPGDAGANDPGVAVAFSATAVTPIPAPLALFAGGVGLLGILGWRGQKRAAVKPAL